MKFLSSSGQKSMPLSSLDTNVSLDQTFSSKRCTADWTWIFMSFYSENWWLSPVKKWTWKFRILGAVGLDILNWFQILPQGCLGSLSRPSSEDPLLSFYKRWKKKILIQVTEIRTSQNRFSHLRWIPFLLTIQSDICIFYFSIHQQLTYPRVVVVISSCCM